MPAVSSRGRGRRTISEPNMVPFIDVMLVLLIIFMVTAPLISPSMIDLPSIGKAAKQPDVVIQIILGKNDALEMKVKENTTAVTLSNLAEQVQQAQKNPALALKDPTALW
jgi:biopolymer transport protein TolR